MSSFQPEPALGTCPVGPSGDNLIRFSHLVVLSSALAMLAGGSSAALADAAAGKATFTAVCAECHEVADFEGEDATAMQGRTLSSRSSPERRSTRRRCS